MHDPPGVGVLGGYTGVALLQLCLGVQAPMQGIFQYNNVPGSHLNVQQLRTGEAIRSIQTHENQLILPSTGQYGCTQYFYRLYVKSEKSRSFQTFDR
jgi:hypothetical protein